MGGSNWSTGRWIDGKKAGGGSGGEIELDNFYLLMLLLAYLTNNTITIISEPSAISYFKFVLQITIPPLAAAGAALYSTHLSAKHNLKIEEQRNRHENAKRRQEAYSLLMGHKIMNMQASAAHYGEAFQTPYWEALAIIRGIERIDNESNLKEKIKKIISYKYTNEEEFKRSKEYDMRSRDLAVKIGESGERLWETIGLIQTLFPDIPDEKIKPIMDFKFDKFNDFARETKKRNEYFKKTVGSTATSIESISNRADWTEKMREGQKELETVNSEKLYLNNIELGDRIDILLEYMLDEIQKERVH